MPRSIPVLLLVLILGAPGALARGQRHPAGAPPESAELLIGAPPRLLVGAVAAVELTVRIPGSGGQPLLLTPSIEGEAVRVARGRLLRDDAVRADASTLTFALPVLGRRPGAALLRVSLLTYRCDATTCQELRMEASQMLQVSAHERSANLAHHLAKLTPHAIMSSHAGWRWPGHGSDRRR